MLDRFAIDHAQPSWPVNRWVGAMLRLYRPYVVALIAARDAALANWRENHPDRDAYEDRELEITSLLDISIGEDIPKIEAALEAAK